MDKKFYRVDTDFSYQIGPHLHTALAGSFIDSDTDMDVDINEALLQANTHEEEPVWAYYSFAKGMPPVYQVLDGVTSRDEAMRIGLDMKAHESFVRQQRMFECGIVLGLEDANLLTESGRGVCEMERFIFNW